MSEHQALLSKLILIIGIYMNALDIPEDVAYTYVQKNIVNNTLH